MFSILGTTYGGDGRTTFGLPDLRGRVPIGPGNGPGLSSRRLGERIGTEHETLSVAQMPSHNYAANATNSSATQTQPADNILATAATPQYLNPSTTVLMADDFIGSTGGGQAHNNMPPALGMNYIICVSGIFPSRN